MSIETLHKVRAKTSDFDPTKFQLEITTSQGGIGMHLEKGEPIDDVIAHLRQFADRLEKDVAEREKGQTK